MYGHIGISTDGIVRAACQWDSGCADGPYGLIASIVVMRRCYCIGSLDLGRQTGDGVARAAFWWNRARVNSLYELIELNHHSHVLGIGRSDYIYV